MPGTSCLGGVRTLQIWGARTSIQNQRPLNVLRLRFGFSRESCVALGGFRVAFLHVACWYSWSPFSWRFSAIWHPWRLHYFFSECDRKPPVTLAPVVWVIKLHMVVSSLWNFKPRITLDFIPRSRIIEPMKGFILPSNCPIYVVLFIACAFLKFPANIYSRAGNNLITRQARARELETNQNTYRNHGWGVAEPRDFYNYTILNSPATLKLSI